MASGCRAHARRGRPGGRVALRGGGCHWPATPHARPDHDAWLRKVAANAKTCTASRGRPLRRAIWDPEWPKRLRYLTIRVVPSAIAGAKPPTAAQLPQPRDRLASEERRCLRFDHFARFGSTRRSPAPEHGRLPAVRRHRARAARAAAAAQLAQRGPHRSAGGPAPGRAGGPLPASRQAPDGVARRRHPPQGPVRRHLRLRADLPAPGQQKAPQPDRFLRPPQARNVRPGGRRPAARANPFGPERRPLPADEGDQRQHQPRGGLVHGSTRGFAQGDEGDRGHTRRTST
jgi:hypothetical protein